MGSSQTRARTRVPCTGRQILNHCATREALKSLFNLEFKSNFIVTTENGKLLSTLVIEGNCKNKYSENIIGIQEDMLSAKSSEPEAFSWVKGGN